MKISVIIPNYNSGKYLEKCLDSIFRQSHRNFEVIVVDGYSTDNSVEILKKYKKLHKNLYVIFTRTQGESAHINVGMERADGDIVAYLCADDTYEPTCLETVVRYFINTKTQWVYGKSKIINGDDKEVRRFVTSAKEVFQRRYSYTALQCVDFIVQLTVFMKRELYQEIGDYNTELKYGMDYDCCLRAGGKSKPVFIDTYLANWRAHSESISEKEHKAEALQALRIQKRYSKWQFRPIQWCVYSLTVLLYWLMGKK